MLTATICNYVILICRVLAFLTVELRSRLLRLFSNRFGEGRANSTRRNELGGHINAITRASFAYGLNDISVMGLSIILYGVDLCLIQRILNRFFTFPSNIRGRDSILLRATNRIMRIRMDLCITDRRIEDICRMDETSKTVTRARIETNRASQLLKIMERMYLAILINVIASGLRKILINACHAINARAMRLNFRRAFTARKGFFLLKR